MNAKNLRVNTNHIMIKKLRNEISKLGGDHHLMNDTNELLIKSNYV